jgi:catechol 2,3-dioxygenase-like lactoylglutathione lyase family enzyme
VGTKEADAREVIGLIDAEGRKPVALRVIAGRETHPNIFPKDFDSDVRTDGSSMSLKKIGAKTEEADMAVKRLDNIGIVVEDLGAAIDFFQELGLELEGRATIEGEWAGRVTGLGDQHVEIAMMRTPDGHSRLELSRFLRPEVVADHRNAPVNSLGYLRAMFTVDDVEETVERLRTHGAQLVGDVVRYENAYKLCYIRGPEGLLIGLAEELG